MQPRYGPAYYAHSLRIVPIKLILFTKKAAQRPHYRSSRYTTKIVPEKAVILPLESNRESASTTARPFDWFDREYTPIPQYKFSNNILRIKHYEIHGSQGNSHEVTSVRNTNYHATAHEINRDEFLCGSNSFDANIQWQKINTKRPKWTLMVVLSAKRQPIVVAVSKLWAVFGTENTGQVTSCNQNEKRAWPVAHCKWAKFNLVAKKLLSQH